MKVSFFSMLAALFIVLSLPNFCQSGDLAELKICKEKTLAAAALIKAEGESAFSKIRDPAGAFWYSNGKGYIWVHDLEGVVVIHPVKPAMEGQNFLELRDVHGIYIYAEMNNLVLQEGQGWVPYSWRKPGERGSSPKISFVVLVENGDKKYVVGSGMYDFTVEDVRAAFPEDPIYEE